jgi:hypothetical protein
MLRCIQTINLSTYPHFLVRLDTQIHFYFCFFVGTSAVCWLHGNSYLAAHVYQFIQSKDLLQNQAVVEP